MTNPSFFRIALIDDDYYGEKKFAFGVTTIQDGTQWVPILFLMIPVIMIVFDSWLLMKNIKQNSALNIETMEKADNWSNFVIEAGDLKSLVQTYRRDYQVAMDFKALHKQFNGKNFQTNMFEAETLWQAKWFPLLLAAVVMVM